MNQTAGRACVLGWCYSSKTAFAGKAQMMHNATKGRSIAEFRRELDDLGEYLNMLETFRHLR